ncbi:unnamed protein product, partial [Symbiodinium pilosum]
CPPDWLCRCRRVFRPSEAERFQRISSRILPRSLLHGSDSGHCEHHHGKAEGRCWRSFGGDAPCWSWSVTCCRGWCCGRS